MGENEDEDEGEVYDLLAVFRVPCATCTLHLHPPIKKAQQETLKTKRWCEERGKVVECVEIV
jgi:hypothetical protein